MLAPETGDEIRERIEGQTSDLTWARVPAASTGAEATRALALPPLRRARALARGTGATVVVWVDEGPGRFEIAIVDVEAGRVLLREIPFDDAERTANLEAAALIVRSALQTLERGGHIGVRPARPVASPAEPSPPSPPTSQDSLPTSADTTAEHIVEPAARALHFDASLGGTSLLRGHAVITLEATLRINLGALHVAVGLVATAPDTLSSQGVSLRLRGLLGVAEAGATWRGSRRLELTPAARIEWGRVERRTEATPDGLAPTVARASTIARGGLVFRLGASVTERLTLGFRVGVLVTLTELRFAAPIGGELATLARSAPATPLASVFLGIRLR